MSENEQLMTEDEMTKRLTNGEDALDLSIEKWKRILTVYERGTPITSPITLSDVDSATCALCRVSSEKETVNEKDEFHSHCVFCSYYKHFGYRCDDKYNGGHWVFPSRSLNVGNIYPSLNFSAGSIRTMIDALKEVKSANVTIEEVSD